MTIAAFTYFGPDSSPYQRACMLMSACEATTSCTDCFTESTVDCLCAVPRECYVNDQNVIGVVNVQIVQEEVCSITF